jgi:hypothetical protein
MVSDTNPNYGLGIPAFWEPSLFETKPFLVTKLEKSGKGILVEAERKIDLKSNAKLAGLLVTHRIEVGELCESLKITTVLKNPQSDELPKTISCGFRYHILPQCMSDENGSIIMRNGDDEVVFKRKYERLTFARKTSKAKDAVRKLFEIGTKSIDITSPSIVLTSKKIPGKLFLELSPDNLFAGFACWDEPSMKTTTFEPFFEKVTLPPGKSAKFALSLDYKRKKN